MPCSGNFSDVSVASTSLMRVAQTEARGIIVVMKLTMMTPMRICIVYEM